MDSLNYSYDHGELSQSQKEAVITLIQKKDKDRRLIKNWRPISLVNVDVKIGTKAIAKKIRKGSTIYNTLRSKCIRERTYNF